MNKNFDFKFPQIGETSSGGIIVRWLKKEGESVTENEPLLEVTTDKIATEITSPVTGILEKIVAFEGSEVFALDLLAKISVISDEESSFCDKHNNKEEKQYSNEGVCKNDFTVDSNREILEFSPVVLSLIQREGLSPVDLRCIKGTGNAGRITKKDIERYLSTKNSQQDSDTRGKDLSFNTSAIEDRIPMSALRQAIASSISKSSYEVPHSSLMIDVDFTDLVNLIAKEKERFLAVHKVKLTVTSFIIQALAQVLQQFPLLNSFLDGNTIVVKRRVNVGVAVNLNKEGVVVPILKNCQEKNLVSIAKELSDFANRARLGKLNLDEVKEGTITLTNFGMNGALLGIPIIRYPEVAIIGVGAIKKTVVVKEDDSFAIRKIAYLTLTFDHRLLDGIYGSEFLSALKNRLESVTLG